MLLRSQASRAVRGARWWRSLAAPGGASQLVSAPRDRLLVLTDVGFWQATRRLPSSWGLHTARQQGGDPLSLFALAGVALGCTAFACSRTSTSPSGVRCDGGDRTLIFSGHVSGIQFQGSALLKKLQSEGRGDREATYLPILSASPAWSPFVPKFNGIVKDVEGGSWLSMDNLTAGMKKPVVMDLKVGTRHYSPGETPKKRHKEMMKAQTTTISTLGLRVVGCRIPGSKYGDDDAEDWGYKPGRDPSAEELPAVIHRFLRTEGRQRQARAFAMALLEHFRVQGDYVFMGSSLLLAYDSALGDEAPLHVRMIDFGHVHTMTEMRAEAQDEGRLDTFEARDVGYIKGLTTLVEILGGEGQAMYEGMIGQGR
mmetsp:Transcript_81631/g.205409  ORF Transcript_81631/g.205409 Transcript_81631/m.205409 type:complete len:369 (-) Transcript_81631:12-1118(-)